MIGECIWQAESCSRHRKNTDNRIRHFIYAILLPKFVFFLLSFLFHFILHFADWCWSRIYSSVYLLLLLMIIMLYYVLQLYIRTDTSELIVYSVATCRLVRSRERHTNTLKSAFYLFMTGALLCFHPFGVYL